MEENSDPHDNGGTARRGRAPRRRQRIRRTSLTREAIIERLGPAYRIDVTLFRLINGGHRHPHLDSFYQVLTFIFNGGWAWLIGVALFLPFRHSRARAWRLLRLITLPTWVAALGVEGPIKQYFRRHRPFHVEAEVVLVGREPGNWSFPSGHAAATFGGARMMQRGVPRWAWLWYAIASLVAYSRVYLGVHYPGDVTVGALFGIGLAELTHRLQRRLAQKCNSARIS